MVFSLGGSCTVYACMSVLDIHAGHGNPYKQSHSGMYGG